MSSFLEGIVDFRALGCRVDNWSNGKNGKTHGNSDCI